MDIDGDSSQPSFAFPLNFSSPLQQQQPQQPQPQQQHTSAWPLARTTAAPTQAAPLGWGLIVPGGQVRTDFVPVDSTKLVLTLSCPGDVPVPLSSVTELVVFSTTPESIPLDQGVLWYWQVSLSATSVAMADPGGSHAVASSTGFVLLGALTAARPSGVLPTRWSEHEQVAEFAQHQSSSTQTDFRLTITIGVSLEPLSNITNILQGQSDTIKASSKLVVAQKIAADLFRYMQSFDDASNNRSAQNGMMMVPQTIFDRWFQRFESRLRRDPNFFLHSSE